VPVNARGARTQRRAAERRQRGKTQLVIPDAIRKLATPTTREGNDSDEYS
jgi:hypothetical protein